jgi:hypothetical protein
MEENGTPIKIHQVLLAFYGEHTVDTSTVHCWVRKSRHSGGNLDLTDQPWSGRPVTATYDLHKEKVNELIQEN